MTQEDWNRRPPTSPPHFSGDADGDPPSTTWLRLIYVWNLFWLVVLAVVLIVKHSDGVPVSLAEGAASLLLAAGVGWLAWAVHRRNLLALRIQLSFWWVFAGFMTLVAIVHYMGLDSAVFGPKHPVHTSILGVIFAAVLFYFSLRHCHRLVQYQVAQQARIPPEELAPPPGWDEASAPPARKP
ncbi:MAG: hypothetical protein ACREJ2_16175 [Planctomycetota bacterium]